MFETIFYFCIFWICITRQKSYPKLWTEYISMKCMYTIQTVHMDEGGTTFYIGNNQKWQCRDGTWAFGDPSLGSSFYSYVSSVMHWGWAYKDMALHRRAIAGRTHPSKMRNEVVISLAQGCWNVSLTSFSTTYGQRQHVSNLNRLVKLCLNPGNVGILECSEEVNLAVCSSHLWM